MPHFTCQAAAGVAIGFLYTECPIYGWEVDAAGIVMLAGTCVESACCILGTDGGRSR